MWGTADTKMSASLIIPKRTVIAKTAPPENVLKDIEEVVGMVKHVKEEKLCEFTHKEKDSNSISNLKAQVESLESTG